MQTPTAAQQAEPAPATASKRSRAGRLLRGFIRFILTTALVIAGLWAILALMLADLDGHAPRFVPAILFALAFFAVISETSVTRTRGLDPAGARATIWPAPSSVVVRLPFRPTAMACSSARVAVTRSPTLIWSKLMHSLPR